MVRTWRYIILRRLQTRPNMKPKVTRKQVDLAARWILGIFTIAAILLLPMIGIGLVLRAWPILHSLPPRELLLSSLWRPLQGAFGFLPFIMSTLWVTAIAMILAIPPSLLTSIYLAEYAQPHRRALAKPLIDLLAGIPSVVYGIWGVLTIVPFVEKIAAPTLGCLSHLFPLFRVDNPTGYGVLAAGLVLAVMVFPILIAVAEEVIRAVPQGLREASLALGATRWQTVRNVVLRRAFPGVFAAIVLAFSRAFGETMAVLMVVGNVPQIPSSLFDAAYPLTALIANNYGEMMSIPLYDSALMTAALILLIVVLIFNLASRMILLRIKRAAEGEAV